MISRVGSTAGASFRRIGDNLEADSTQTRDVGEQGRRFAQQLRVAGDGLSTPAVELGTSRARQEIEFVDLMLPGKRESLGQLEPALPKSSLSKAARDIFPTTDMARQFLESVGEHFGLRCLPVRIEEPRQVALVHPNGNTVPIQFESPHLQAAYRLACERLYSAPARATQNVGLNRIDVRA